MDTLNFLAFLADLDFVCGRLFRIETFLVLLLSGVREVLLSSQSHGSHQQRSFNETDLKSEYDFPLVIVPPLFGGVSDECAAQSAAFARMLVEREPWALQSEQRMNMYIQDDPT